VFNSFYVGCVLIAVAGLFTNWYMERHPEDRKPHERGAAAGMFVWGLAWWTFAGLIEIDHRAGWHLQANLTLLFFTGSAAAFSLLWQRIGWRAARFPALALLPLMALCALASAFVYASTHPSAGLGWLAWPLAFAVHLWLLRRHEPADQDAPSDWIEHLHAGFVWLLAAIGAWEVAWAIDQLVAGQAAWPLIAWALVPAAILVLLALRGERIAWPVRAHLNAYLVNGAAALAVFLWLWVIYTNAASNGDPAPLPYVPIFSPLDLTQIGALLVIVLWLRALRRLQLVQLAGEYAVVGAAAFVTANGILLRTLHHWAGVPFHLETMLRSTLVHTALSIFWTILAMCTMVIAARLKLRALWIAGAVLMGVVVVKLFLVDLSNVGGVERIVSFIGVGVLMLLIGYMSPVPPRIQEQAK
jgi:uncharacterized membrane protein